MDFKQIERFSLSGISIASLYAKGCHSAIHNSEDAIMFIPADTHTAPMLHIVLIFLGAILVVISTVGSVPDHESKSESAD
jgi:hypothetical protein